MDAREGVAPSSRDLQSRAWAVSATERSSCQGRDRTAAFRVTAGRLSPRLPGIGLAGTIRTCDLRVRNAVLCSPELRRGVALRASTAGVEPAASGFVDRRLFHSATSTRIL